MKYYEFSLILNVTELDATLKDNLFEAGCDDALLGMEDGVAYLDFNREAESFNAAFSSAIQQVESVMDMGSIARVEPDELVTLAEIGQRVGRSRESIRLLASGQRGKGNFPIPLRGTRSRPRIWRWSEVAPWLSIHGVEVGTIDIEQATAIATINAILQIRKSQPHQGNKLLGNALQRKEIIDGLTEV